MVFLSFDLLEFSKKTFFFPWIHKGKKRDIRPRAFLPFTEVFFFVNSRLMEGILVFLH
jgi:hypothetical protein